MNSEALKKTYEAGYQAVANDARREADAQEWIEALNQDALAVNDLEAVMMSGGLSSTPPSASKPVKPTPL